MPTKSVRLFVLCTLWGAFLCACSDSTAPTPPSSNEASFDGSFDPLDNSFLLSRIQEPDNPPLAVDLRGSNLQLDAQTSTLSIDVAVVNQSGQPLYPPAIIWVQQFTPIGVTVQNPDILPPYVGPLDPDFFGFDYSNLLGSDGVLMADESSEPHTWVIHDPNLGSFSFVAHAEFGLAAGSSISGTTFHDSNYDGTRQRNEGPLEGALIRALSPSGQQLEAMPNEMGFYRLSVTEPGLYQVQLESSLACVASLWDCPMCYTTPRIRQVFLTPDPDGRPLSLDQVDFGAVPGPCPGTPWPTHLTEAPPDSLMPQDVYALLAGTIEGKLLTLWVSFSGCSIDHEFALFAGLPFTMESGEAHTWLRLTHDDRGELCDAWFERSLTFDLQSVIDAYLQSHGETGPIVLELVDPAGQKMQFRLEP
jgi:hypothetical protein